MAGGTDPARGTSARLALRAATREVHERLHEAEPFRRIAEGRLKREDYAGLLGRIWRFHALLAEGAGVAQPQRMARLEADLGFLGRDVPRGAGGWCAPEVEGAALGCRYVAEGSALGGRVIWRQLDYLLGGGADGRRYFGGAPGDGARWRSLCALLDETGRRPEMLAGMIAGAGAAFALFEHCLDVETAYA